MTVFFVFLNIFVLFSKETEGLSFAKQENSELLGKLAVRMDLLM